MSAVFLRKSQSFILKTNFYEYLSVFSSLVLCQARVAGEERTFRVAVNRPAT